MQESGRVFVQEFLKESRFLVAAAFRAPPPELVSRLKRTSPVDDCAGSCSGKEAVLSAVDKASKRSVSTEFRSEAIFSQRPES